MGRLFLALLRDKDCVEDGRGDKRYDQFLNQGMLCVLERPEPGEAPLAEVLPVSASKKRKCTQEEATSPEATLPRSRKRARADQKAAARTRRGRVDAKPKDAAMRRSARLAAKGRGG
ncbi:hypothetical protein PsYK624_026680 [Phanerochaete sordida]|uniref:Uncharacterized protein n=1 Tax=Phanerochaete sordida TaxID=48140 RepID=A0A9P3G1L5_9APHY|nr:hypothetical protein PsYK624_026680 [Phanerochaete sordida]